MNRKKIQRAIESSFKKMKLLSKKIFTNQAMENIHSFRIEVKKLRAFLRLIQQVENKNTIHFPKQIKKLYEILGQIRTLQLQQLNIHKILKKTNADAPEKYLSNLHAETLTQIARANKLLARKKFFREKNLIAKLPNKISKTSLNKYLSSQKDKLSILTSVESLADEQIHQIRKIIKDLLYISPYIINKKKNPDHFFLHKIHIKKITDTLGNIHDICITINLLSPDSINKISSVGERDLLQSIRRQLQEEKKEKKSKIELDKYQALLN